MPTFRPGPTTAAEAAELNRMRAALARQGGFRVAPPLAWVPTAGGPLLQVQGVRQLWARVYPLAPAGSGSGAAPPLPGSAYSWVAVRETDAPDFPEDYDLGPEGAGSFPAYEVQGREDVPDGEPVRLFLAKFGGYWLFRYDGPGTGSGAGDYDYGCPGVLAPVYRYSCSADGDLIETAEWYEWGIRDGCLTRAAVAAPDGSDCDRGYPLVPGAGTDYDFVLDAPSWFGLSVAAGGGGDHTFAVDVPGADAGTYGDDPVVTVSVHNLAGELLYGGSSPLVAPLVGGTSYCVTVTVAPGAGLPPGTTGGPATLSVTGP